VNKLTTDAKRVVRKRRSDAKKAAEKRSLLPDDGLALNVLSKFREVFRAARLHFSAVKRSVGVSAAELWALGELHRYPGSRVSDLAALLSLRQSTVSNLVDGLANGGMITRERNDPDGRVVRLYLTKAGQRAVIAAPRSARGILPDALERLSSQDLRRLDRQLDVLLGAMARRAPGAAKAHLEET
jgi:DNA-binding MarR family transcriptional regulator